MAQSRITNTTVLAVFPCEGDHASLLSILDPSRYEARFTRSFEGARCELQAFTFGAVIAEARFPDGRSWKDLLHVTQSLGGAPPLIVADRLADERLWAEVLNLGGHDLLAKPFEPKEVLYAVSMAYRRQENQEQMATRAASQSPLSSLVGPR